MGCICSTEPSSNPYTDEKLVYSSSVRLVAPPSVSRNGSTRTRPPSNPNSGSLSGLSYPSSTISSHVNSGSLSGLSYPPSKVGSRVNSGSLSGSSHPPLKLKSQVSLSRNREEGENNATTIIVVERPSKRYHQRRATVDLGAKAGQKPMMTRIVSLPRGAQGEQVIAGWPAWLASVAGEAIQGWLPRRTDSFTKLAKIGQGTYSSVYKARDLESGKIVAMKRVRFVSMDPESVRFMAREILILRKLDHPNVIKLQGLVISGNLYLVFEYMEHDFAGLLATPGIKFTEPQIKCYMQQLLKGLEHCHSNGVLHRDIKGSNLLINNEGMLKIGDFGLATLYKPGQKQPLTSRVVTLWYRAPELLLGCTDYGFGVDMWSVGCILAELFVGKPILPGRTEVEQMHKIFKLCGSPTEEYWRSIKLKEATSFKPQLPYPRQLVDKFKDFPPPALTLVNTLLSIDPHQRGSASTALHSQFFTSKPLPCDPSELPKYPPSNIFQDKLADEEPRRRKAENVKGRGPESIRRGTTQSKPTVVKGQTNLGSTGIDYNGVSHCSTMVHPSATKHWTSKAKDDASIHASVPPHCSRNNTLESTSLKPDIETDWAASNEVSMGYVPKKNRIYHSGPLVPPGANLEDMLKDHERQIQHAVRRSRIDKARNTRP